MPKLSSLLAPPPSRCVRFCQPPSPLRLDIIMEGSESNYSDSDKEQTFTVFADEKALLKGGRKTPNGHSSPHRNPTTPASILKRKSQVENEKHDVTEEHYNFEISVISYRTSCCRTPLSIEHISDWLHDSPSDGHCPSCKARCSFEPSTRLIVPPQSAKADSFSPQRQRYTKPHSLVPPTNPPAYTFFDADGEAYPTTEHSSALGSSTDISECFTRVTSIAGLTLFLFALLS